MEYANQFSALSKKPYVDDFISCHFYTTFAHTHSQPILLSCFDPIHFEYNILNDIDIVETVKVWSKCL